MSSPKSRVSCPASGVMSAKCSRVVFGLVSVHMLLLAVCVCSMFWGICAAPSRQLHHIVLADVVFVMWILCLLYGGGAGLYAVRYNCRVAALETLGCWVLAMLIHFWFLAFGVHEIRQRLGTELNLQVAPERRDTWTLVLHATTDVASAVCLLQFVRVLGRTCDEPALNANELELLIGARNKACYEEA